MEKHFLHCIDLAFSPTVYSVVGESAKSRDWERIANNIAGNG